jgi:predicted RNA binding protein YcfA (HicA-like mRNA interferase family)
MKKIIKYLVESGYIENQNFRQSDHNIAYEHPNSRDMVFVSMHGKEYSGEYVRVYTENAISTSKYKSTRSNDILTWLKTKI